MDAVAIFESIVAGVVVCAIVVSSAVVSGIFVSGFIDVGAALVILIVVREILVVDEDNVSDVKSDSAIDIAANEGRAEEGIAAVAA